MTWAFLMNSVPMTRAVIRGETSLGGSESSLVGLARALVAQGEEVTIFSARLGEGEKDTLSGHVDLSGVTWHRLEDFHQMNRFVTWDVVCSQRQLTPFARRVNAQMRLLWNQDLLVPGQMVNDAMAVASTVDRIAYVSAYHRAQWEQQAPDLTPLGWVTRNGYDPAHVPSSADTVPHRIIHTSRPERGLGPLLEMWPRLRELEPEAELRLCRYSSMYDQGPGSWSDICAEWDRAVARVNEAVGGITYLGELTKPALYEELAQAAVMWYPGLDNFAETGCIAAIEAQACGTPVVGSYRGVLPDVVHFGQCIEGSVSDAAYQEASIAAVREYLEVDAPYMSGQALGAAAMQQHTYSAIAAEWRQMAHAFFRDRSTQARRQVLARLLYDDDHVSALRLAQEMGASDVITECQRVINGDAHTAEEYGEAAIANPLLEVKSARFQHVVPMFKDCKHVLDAAGGNGSFAIALCLAHPHIRVTSLDYAEANTERAAKAAAEAGVADRCNFQTVTVYDYDWHTLHDDFEQFMTDMEGVAEIPPLDGLFVGEFIEHLANVDHVIERLEASIQHGGTVVYTCPHGACVELLPPRMPHHKGHVHRFNYDDIHTVWGSKDNLRVQFLDSGDTIRGVPLGNWIIHYTARGLGMAQPRDLAGRIRKTRPLKTLSVGIIAKDAGANLQRCLDSVYGLADEIVVGIDPTSTDDTRLVAKRYGRTVRTIDITSPMDHEDGFSGSRNEVLDACTGHWFMWIDTDEVLTHPSRLAKYLEGEVFQGYVLKQVHLYIDGPPTHDIPVRVFRNDGSIRFYGCVHEQPQVGDANGEIAPSLELADTFITHFGYLEEGQREYKRVTRNLPLLMRDRDRFADRELGKVLLIRESVIAADGERATAGGMTPRAQTGYAEAVRLFTDYFDDPSHKFHKLARPWYESALKHLGLGWEMSIAMSGRDGSAGGLEGRTARAENIWVRDADEYVRIMRYKMEATAEGLRPPVYITDPRVLLGEEAPRELASQ